MKKGHIILLVLVHGCLCARGQSLRYFQFHSKCNTVWQDTSFVAATSDPAVIDSVLGELAKPVSLRRMAYGQITDGDGGYNHNASHWFLWHYIENQWTFVDLSAELYDGCPYSAVDADTAEWIGHLGRFGPWSSYVVKEIANPASVGNITGDNGVSIYPNPVRDKLTISFDQQQFTSSHLQVVVTDVPGRIIYEQSFLSDMQLDFSKQAPGTYFVIIKDDKGILQRSMLMK